MPRSCPGLGNWAHKQRDSYRNGKLPPGRVKLLEEIGFRWKLQVRKNWDQRFKELKDFGEENGHMRVQQSDTSGLVNWVSHQRTMYKNGKLSPVRIKRLEGIGFRFRAEARGQASLEQQFQEIVELKTEKGSPKASKTSPSLRLSGDRERAKDQGVPAQPKPPAGRTEVEVFGKPSYKDL